jgi:hypothetical protein
MTPLEHESSNVLYFSKCDFGLKIGAFKVKLFSTQKYAIFIFCSNKTIPNAAMLVLSHFDDVVGELEPLVGVAFVTALYQHS